MVTQIVTALHRETCNLACTDLLMNPYRHRTPKLNKSDLYALRVKITRRKNWAWTGIFKPAEPHSPWDAYGINLPVMPLRLGIEPLVIQFNKWEHGQASRAHLANSWARHQYASSWTPYLP